MNNSNHIRLPPDTLQDRVSGGQALDKAVFLNTLPKSGSHLLRNICRAFIDPEYVSNGQCVQRSNLKDRADAFKASLLIWGHLEAGRASIQVASTTPHHIVLVRDPYTWALAKARFMSSDSYTNSADFLKEKGYTANAFISSAIQGIPGVSESLRDLFNGHVLHWIGQNIKIVKFEDLKYYANNLDAEGAEEYFRDLLSFLPEFPEDWKERVALGAKPEHSGTHRTKLNTSVEFPEELTDLQKSLIEYHCPNLRKLLGYT